MPNSRLNTFSAAREPGAATLRKMLNASVPEHSLHLALVEHIQRRARPHVFWTHIPSGEKRPPGVGGKLKGMGLRAGIPDFMFVSASQPYFLELKRNDGRTQPSQREALRDLVGAGAIVAVAYGIDEALRILAEWGLIR